MTPAAPHFDGFAPKAKFRGIHRRVFGTEAPTVNGMKRSPKLKSDQKRLLNSSLSNAESCDEEDISPKRKRFSPISHRYSSAPSTSHKLHCDTHVEFSDEDAEELHPSRGVKASKSETDSVRRNDGYLKQEYSLTHEQSNTVSGPDSQGHNKRSFYIVQNDGRPAEMFRTDLLDRLRKGIDANADSDDEDVPGCGLTRMTDRWRTEWSYGTQVPLHPDATYANETFITILLRRVITASVIMNEVIHCSQQKQRRSLMKKFLSKPYEEFPREPLRLYESTRLDEQWLKLINERRVQMQKPVLSMDAFLKTMNAFEIDCYKNIHRKLLEPLHSPSSRLGEYDEEAACDICRACESEPDDEMVFCDGCNLCVHMSCYGLQVLPPGEWLCMKCRYCFGRNPPCILCPTIGGALKCTDKKNQWAHVVCALWIHECRFGDFEKREPITCIDEIQEERWTAKCSICDTRQGACINCSVSSCKTSFHVTCALRSGLEMRIEQDSDDDKVHMISLCPRHRAAKVLEGDEGKYDQCQQSGSDEETEGESNCGLLTKLERTCYQFVDYKEIAKRLSFDFLCVSDVFEYWKWRRQNNNGKPLVDNLQDEITIAEPEALQLELPDFLEISASETQPVVKRGRGRPRKNAAATEDTAAPPPPPTSYSAKKITKTVRSWGQHLLGLVLRQAKEKRNYLHTCAGAALLIAEHISRPVPLSQRTITYLNESIEGLFTKEVMDEGIARAEEFCRSSEPSTRSDSPFLPTSSRASTPSSSSSESSYNPPSEASYHSPECEHLIITRSKQERNLNDVVSAESSQRRTSFSGSHSEALKMTQRHSLSNDTEQRLRGRRGSLRSSDVEAIARSAGKSDESVETPKPTSAALKSKNTGSATVHNRERIGKDTRRLVDKSDVPSCSTNTSPQRSALPKAVGDASSAQPGSESNNNIERSEIHQRKRLRSSDASATTSPLKTLKSTTKEFTYGPRKITHDRDGVVLNEPRTLRSRASLPPMFQTSRKAEKGHFTSTKDEDIVQSHIKRRSDVGLQACTRTIYAH
ncbi:PHD-finger [Ancylostoma ceylanicum]|uniref:PHD-finger n=1 Tax=Ancylostoma ceylanicum TaxID=53326 RepID=A0A0D6LJI5_9BILA|nr:PHD-finger [Ancylostoma ceylanicum]